MKTRPPLFWFFGLAYALSWGFWIPEALAAWGVPLPPALLQFLSGPFNPAAFGPLIAALALRLTFGGRKETLRWLRDSLHLRFNAIWLLPTLLLPLLIFGGGVLGSILMGATPLDRSILSNPPYALIGFLVILFTAGPFQEELGWRGYALPRLQRRFSPLGASLVVGVLWWLWHLPLVFIPGKFMTQDPLLFLALSLEFILVSILFTWIYNRTQGSVLATMLFHAAMNASIWVFLPSMTINATLLACTVLLLAIGVGVVLAGDKTAHLNSLRRLEKE